MSVEAQSIWALGRELGVTCEGDEGEVIRRLVGLENRDANEQGGVLGNIIQKEGNGSCQ